MRTPSLRRRVAWSMAAILTVLVIALGTFVYLTLRNSLEVTLQEVLETRAGIANDLGAVVGSEGLAERLQALGVPATVTAPDGQVFEAEPAVRRFGTSPPAPSNGLPSPRVSQVVELGNGGTVEVYATRAGVDATLRQVLILLAIGTAAVLAIGWLLVRRSLGVAMAPLGLVAEKADRTAAGHYGERLAPDQPDTELGRMAVAYDAMLDALEAAIAEARAAEARTRQFADDAAHQLRTPIAAIRASVEALLREADPEQRDRLMTNLVRETARSSRVLASLLTTARLDDGLPLDLRPTDLVELCRDEVARAASLSPLVSVTLDEAAAASLELPVEGPRIREAIANLLDNACRHARTSVLVAVRTSASGDVEVVVSDDGDGVPEAQRELVFDRFASLDGHGGSGLGLPIARSVARRHGGDLGYDGEAFVLRLPTHTSAPRAGVDQA